MMDFGNAIEDSEGTDGILTLMVQRDGKPTDVKVQLRKLGRFSPTFPFDCAKTDLIFKEICEYLASCQKNGWGGAVHTLPPMMTLLGSGESKYLPNVKRAAHSLLGIKPYGSPEPDARNGALPSHGVNVKS